jgi:hypothetical protein
LLGKRKSPHKDAQGEIAESGGWDDDLDMM